uniref:Nudix hydrolase domain-containing protein n=1 Tax=Kwoniella dejecticola CBS 10117 TaxID=1296121 RepID=A0A1A6AER9_9TREE|nr:uncharacterized protein I303_00389 [Kwoniella dejecticola CBS 10117]OBR88572.1 hypothetical protein I303_00389 [Kwoniella dejecticola CBS 10117]
MCSSQANASLLNIIRQADNFPNFHTAYPERHPINGKRIEPIGVVPAQLMNEIKGEKGLQMFSIVKKLSEKEKAEKRKIDEKRREKKAASDDIEEASSDLKDVSVDDKEKGKSKGKKKEDYKIVILAIFFSDEVNARGVEGRFEVMARLVEGWRDQKKFGYALKKWTGEKISVYASAYSAIWQKDKELKAAARKPFGNVVLEIERSAAPIFGFTVPNVHLIAHQGEGGDVRIWVQKHVDIDKDGQSREKFNTSVTLSGAVPAGKTPFEAAVTAAHEDAGWTEDFTKAHMKNTGMVSLFQIAKWGGLVPGTYVYDLRLPSEDSIGYQVPKSSDESTTFQSLSISEVFAALNKNEFRPTSAAVMVDFLIRHGHITPENEPNYAKIIRRLHRRTGIAGPGH